MNANDKFKAMVDRLVEKKLAARAEEEANRIVSRLTGIAGVSPTPTQSHEPINGKRHTYVSGHPIRFPSTTMVALARGNPYGRGKTSSKIDQVYRICCDVLANGPAQRREVTQIVKEHVENGSVLLSKLLAEGSLVDQNR